MDDQTTLRAEMALVGAMIIDAKKAAPVLVSKMHAECIGNTVVRRIYAEAMKLFSQYGSVDTIPLLKRLVDVDADETEIKNAVKSCCDEYISIHALHAHIDVVIDSHKTRELTEICRSVLVGGIEDVDQALDEVCEKVSGLLRDGQANNGLKSICEIVPEQYTRLFSKEETGIKTAIPQLDAITRGFRNKNLVILAARPGIGKSALALNWMLEFARRGKKVAFYSMEMSAEELYARCIANLAPANLGVIQDRDFGDHTEQKIIAASDALMKLPIYLDDGGSQTVHKIRADAQIKGVDVVIVDYLQLINSTGKSFNRNDEVSKITRELKQMAMDLNIPVIALSQLKRGKDEENEPRLSDLRDSGSIEQDANMVIFLWHNGKQEDGDEKYIACRVAKNRNGRTGELVLRYRGSIMAFEETDAPVMRSIGRKNAPWEDEVTA